MGLWREYDRDLSIYRIPEFSAWLRRRFKLRDVVARTFIEESGAVHTNFRLVFNTAEEAIQWKLTHL